MDTSSFERSISYGEFKLTLLRKITNAMNVTMHLFGQADWRDIWEITLEKNHTSAISVTLHLFEHTYWGNIWKFTREKSSSSEISVTLHLFNQTTWRGTRWRTVAKSWTILRHNKIRLNFWCCVYIVSVFRPNKYFWTLNTTVRLYILNFRQKLL